MLRPPALVLSLLSCCFGTPAPVQAGEVTQHFPANQAVTNLRTQWRVVWGIENHGGGSEVLYIKEAFFKRVRQGYLQRARRFPERIRVLDASLPIADVRQQLENALADLLVGS